MSFDALGFEKCGNSLSDSMIWVMDWQTSFINTQQSSRTEKQMWDPNYQKQGVFVEYIRKEQGAETKKAWRGT